PVTGIQWTGLVALNGIGGAEIVSGKRRGSIPPGKTLYAAIGSPAGTDLQVGYHPISLHEWFSTDPPSGRKRGKHAIPVVGPEEGGAVPAQRSREQVLLVIGVICLAEQGKVNILICRTAKRIFGARGHADMGEITVFKIDAFPSCGKPLLHKPCVFHTGHGIKVMPLPAHAIG